MLARLAVRVPRLVVAAILFSLAAVTAPAHAEAPSLKPNDTRALTDWNVIAVETIRTDPTKSVPEAWLYMGFVQAAVYDAVVGIRRDFEPYAYDRKPPRPASPTAAAMAAAHRILVEYRPSAKPALDARLAASLAEVRDGKAKTNGVAFGKAVAEHLIALRSTDHRGAAVSYTATPTAGIWRPTPPGNAPFQVAWLGGVTPLLAQSGAQFDPGPPPSLTSAAYTTDFHEVATTGVRTGSTRTPEQSATALYFAGDPVRQFNYALRDQVTARGLDLAESARLLAAVNMSVADALIGAWYAKLKYPLWRPITAIRLADTDGNPATSPNPTWEPFIMSTPAVQTPPYPEWASGYSAVAGAFTRSLARTLGGHQPLNINLIATTAPGVIRHYDTEARLNQDVVDARVWLGIHFRFGDTAGLRVGQAAADYAMNNYFGPTGD
jgi:hypothetical protein